MKRQDPIPLGELLTDFLSKRNLWVGALEGSAKDIWREVAGAYVSGFTEDVFLRDGVLNIRVSSSAVRSEIHIRRRYYIEKMNDALGKQIVKALIIK